MNRFHSLLLAAMLPASLTGAPGPGELGAAPSAAQILERALECAERANDGAVFAQYGAIHTSRTVMLNDAGEASETRLDVYRVRPVDGEAFYELLERDGRAATRRDLEREARRKQRFREHLESEGDLAHETGLGFALTSAVVERYDFELAGRHPDYGWTLHFSPKPGVPPVRRRIDQVLNRLAGTLWIDPEDFGLTRAEFSLGEPLKIWAGLLGSLARFDGRFEQVRLAPGHWLPHRLQLEMGGWVPFQSLRRRVELDWRDYEPAGPGQAR